MEGIINLIFNYIDLIFSTGAIWAIAYAFVIFVIAVCIGIYIESYILRALGLLVLAGITYLMRPLALTNLDVQYFQSFIVEFVGAFVILMLFESWLTEDRGTFAPMAVLTFLVSSIFLAGAPFIERELSIEMAVMILGAFLTTILLKREWWWADSDPSNRYRRDMDMSFANAEFAAQMKNSSIHIKVMARSEDEMEYKLTLLRHTFNISGQSDIIEDRKSNQFITYIAGTIRADVQAPTSPPVGTINMRIFGDVDLVQKAETQLKQLFIFTKSSQRHRSPRGEVESEIQCKVPEVGLGDTLFEHFRDLVLSWRNAAQHAEQQANAAASDARKQAFYHGFARSSQQSAKQLMDKLDSIN